MPLYRGFRTYAEEVAHGCREDLGLRPWSPLPPADLADHLGVPLLPLSDLVPDVPSAVSLLESEGSAFSAATVFDGSRRLVVYNDSHSESRQSSDLAHELAHGLLLHQPRPAFSALGLRDWDDDAEDEAAHLGGALLISRAAAFASAKRGLDDIQVAEVYGCSVQMARWRMSVTGAAKRRR